jgi:hypothetical protein
MRSDLIETFSQLSEQLSQLSEQLRQLPEQLRQLPELPSQLSEQSTGDLKSNYEEKEREEELKKRDKEVFLGLATTLSAISTFAGAFTLSAYFNIKCPFSLTAVYLHSSSLLFLSVPLGLLLVHLLLSALPKDENIPEGLLYAVMLQFQAASLMLALAILYISLAFYFYNDPSNPHYIGIGGIILVASVINVPLLYGIMGTWKIMILSLPKEKPDDGEIPTFRAWIGKKLEKMNCTEIKNSGREFIESCKSGEFKKAIGAYWKTLWKITNTLTLFRPDWMKLHRYIFAFILLEFGAFFVFFALGIVEMVKAPTKCL